MNGAKIIGSKHNPDQAAVIDLLKEALAQALEGNITSVGVVACMATGYAHVMAGRQAADLYMGCGSMQREILDAVSSEGARRVAVSKPTIIHPKGAA